MFFSLFDKKPQAMTPNELEDVIRTTFGGVQSNSGVHVSSDSAMRVSAVYACVRVLSESVAQLPLIIYRQSGKMKERAKDSNLYRVLHDQPNQFQSSFEWREMMQGHVSLRGNAYSLVNKSTRGRVVELLPLHPDRVTPKMDEDYNLIYEVRKKSGEMIIVPPEGMFHLKGISSNGYEGMSPIGISREAVGLSIATEKFGAQLFKNGAKPGGILRHPGKFSSTEVAQRVRDSWDEYTNGEGAHKTALLEEGMEWTKVGMTSEDSQFLETRRFQIEEIARIFRVPSMLLQHSDKASTYASAEQFMLSFVIHTLQPWLVRWEQAIHRQILTPEERRSYFSEFLVDGLLRGDSKSRNEALQIQRRNGIINANEWRRIENMNPRTDPAGEEYIYEANMTTGKDNEPTQN